MSKVDKVSVLSTQLHCIDVGSLDDVAVVQPDPFFGCRLCIVIAVKYQTRDLNTDHEATEH